jgi:ribA/ribD-fused uncharacterized protein
MPHGSDTELQVFFYEREFYVLSNFSSFQLRWADRAFATAEHVYHWEKFRGAPVVQGAILAARSAHEAFRIARANDESRRSDWDVVKVDVMREIIRAKVDQHEYVRRKLLETGDRELVEDTWRDDFWGAGPDGRGQNVLGRLWMELRGQLRGDAPRQSAPATIPPRRFDDQRIATVLNFVSELAADRVAQSTLLMGTVIEHAASFGSPHDVEVLAAAVDLMPDPPSGGTALAESAGAPVSGLLGGADPAASLSDLNFVEVTCCGRRLGFVNRRLFTPSAAARAAELRARHVTPGDPFGSPFVNDPEWLRLSGDPASYALPADGTELPFRCPSCGAGFRWQEGEPARVPRHVA